MNKKIKLAADIAMGLLYLLLLGYALTGGLFHEWAGVAFGLLAIGHNLLNLKWYKALKKTKKYVAVINMALLADMAVLLVTGVLQSQHLFFGIRAPAIRQIHLIAALAGLVLLVCHVLNHGRVKGKKWPVMAALAVVLAVALGLWGLPYLNRHFRTVQVDRAAAVAGEQVDMGASVLTVYFTRLGNTDFAENIDAVSGASLMIDEHQALVGSSQLLAEMVQNAAGGDILPITTEKKYPSSYSATVSAASSELKQDTLPALLDLPPDLDGYDTVVLVYPVWWGTIPKPVEAFLKAYDFSDKTVYPLVSHGGSGKAKSVEAIGALCPRVGEPLVLYCGDIPQCRKQVTAWLQKLQ